MFPYGKDEQFLQQKSYNSRFDPTFTLRKDEQFLQQKSYNSRLDPTFTLTLLSLFGIRAKFNYFKK